MDPGLDALRRVKPLGSAGGEIRVYDRGELAADGSWHLGTFPFYQIAPSLREPVPVPYRPRLSRSTRLDSTQLDSVEVSSTLDERNRGTTQP